VLVHKKLGNHTYCVAMDNPRLTAVRCQLKNNNDIIIASVYMPFNDSSVQCYNDFLSVIGVMQGLVDKYYSCMPPCQNNSLAVILTLLSCPLPAHVTF